MSYSGVVLQCYSLQGVMSLNRMKDERIVVIAALYTQTYT